MFLLPYIFLIFLNGEAQIPTVIFPDKTWERADPFSNEWSSANIQQARDFFDSLPPASLILIYQGKTVIEWGDPGMRIKISSMRKSLLSALFGIFQQKGVLDLDKNLASLDINDEPALTSKEQMATVRMLLESRSGVYHSYVAGTPVMRANQPERGSHPPGTYWYYNNWDFNALGTIFEKQTHKGIAFAFKDQIATPLEMQDFRLEDMYYLNEPADAKVYERSIHPAYHFRLTARDLARFGYLFLQKGNWKGNQIIPKKWVAESTTSYSNTGNGAGYGHLWWVNGFELPDKNFSAQGALGKYLIIFPDRDIVIVFLNHTEFPDYPHDMNEADYQKLPSASYKQVSHLLHLLLETHIKE